MQNIEKTNECQTCLNMRLFFLCTLLFLCSSVFKITQRKAHLPNEACFKFYLAQCAFTLRAYSHHVLLSLNIVSTHKAITQRKARLTSKTKFCALPSESARVYLAKSALHKCPRRVIPGQDQGSHLHELYNAGETHATIIIRFQAQSKRTARNQMQHHSLVLLLKMHHQLLSILSTNVKTVHTIIKYSCF